MTIMIMGTDMSPEKYHYLRDPAEIYRRSFALIDAAVDRASLPPGIGPVAARLVHACGREDIIPDLACSEGAAAAGRVALASGARIYTDAEMVAAGIAYSCIGRPGNGA